MDIIEYFRSLEKYYKLLITLIAILLILSLFFYEIRVYIFIGIVILVVVFGIYFIRDHYLIGYSPNEQEIYHKAEIRFREKEQIDEENKSEFK